MKILCFADPHGDMHDIEAAMKKAKKCDFALLAGDHTWFGQEEADILRIINKYKIKTYVIHGNHENEEETAAIAKKLKYVDFVHRKVIRLTDHDKNAVLVAYGGGGFSAKDPEFEAFIKKSKKQLKKNDKIILLVHGPPYKTKLDHMHSSYVGCKSRRNIVKKDKRIKLLVCGHIHFDSLLEADENSFERGIIDELGNAVIINPGPMGVIVEL